MQLDPNNLRCNHLEPVAAPRPAAPRRAGRRTSGSLLRRVTTIYMPATRRGYSFRGGLMTFGMLLGTFVLLGVPAAQAALTDPNTPAAKLPFALPPEKAEPTALAKFDGAPVIDGRLDDEVWQTASVLKDLYPIQPCANAPASRETVALVGYDAKHLYVAFRVTDDPDKVRANVAKRDGIFDDDYVGFYLDTFNDRRRAYEVFFNPL